MADIEKKILVEATIVSNYLKAAEEVERLKSGLASLKKETAGSGYEQTQLNKKIAEQKLAITQATAAQREAVKQLQKNAKEESVQADLINKTSLSLGEMTKALRTLNSISFAGKTAEEISSIKQQTADLASNIAKAKAELKGLDVSSTFTNLASSLQVVSAGTQVVVAGLSAMGVESETVKQLNASMLTLIATTQALGVVTEYLEKKRGALLVANLKNIAAGIKEAVVNQANALTFKLLGSSADVATASFKAWRAVILTLGIGALIAMVVFLIKNLSDLKQKTEVVSAVNKRSAEIIADTETKYRMLQRQYAALANDLDKKKKFVYENSDAFRELGIQVNNVNDADNVLIDNAPIVIQALRNKTKAAAAAMLAAEKQKDATKAELDLEEAREELLERQNFLRKRGVTENIIDSDQEVKRIKLYISTLEDKFNKANKIVDNFFSFQEKKIEESNEQLKEADVKQVDAHAAAIQSAERKAALDLLNQRRDNDLATLEQRKLAAANLIKEEEGFQSEIEAVKRSYQLRLFNSDQDFEQKRLDMQRSFAQQSAALAIADIQAQEKAGSLSSEEAKARTNIITLQLRAQEQAYKASTAALLSSQKQFNQQYVKEAEQATKALIKSTDSYVASSLKSQLSLLQGTYADEVKKVNAQIIANKKLAVGLTGDERAAVERSTRELQLRIYQMEYQLKKKKEELTYQHEEVRKNIISASVYKIYKDDLDKFTNNEIEKLKVTIQSLEEEKKRREQQGLSTFDLDAQLVSAREQLISATTKKELLNAQLTSLAKINIQRNEVDEKIKLYHKDSLEYAQLLAERKQLDQDYWMEASDLAISAMGSISQVVSQVSSLMQDAANQRMESINQEAELEKASLQLRLDNNELSMAEYNARTKKLENDRQREAAKAQREAAKREKANALFSATISTAQAIANALTTTPFLPMGPIMAGVAAAMGAIQVALIASKPLPKAARGGLVGGRSHAMGGTVIEAEKGEVIINKQSARMFGSLLSGINQAGGGVAIPNDGGIAIRNATANQSELVQALREAVANITIVTNIVDVERSLRARETKNTLMRL